mgnify:CR=1 FL=1
MNLSFNQVIRYFQVCIVSCFCFYFFLIVINNIIDYETNFAFVKHVMSMDDTNNYSLLKLRKITSAAMHNFTFLLIITWELVCGLLLGMGAFQLVKSMNLSAFAFQQAKTYALLGLSFSVCLWFFGFIIVGGEWFLMWQSKRWNANSQAFLMLAVTLLSILVLIYSDREESVAEGAEACSLQMRSKRRV